MDGDPEDATADARERLDVPGAKPRIAGAVAVLAGTALALWYPLHFTEPTLGDPYVLSVPSPTDPMRVYLTLSGGAVLLTWGTFASFDRSIRPLTVRRSVLAPLSTALVAAAGVARFTYEYASEVPFELPSDTGGPPRTVDPTVTEIVLEELTSGQVVAVAAASVTVVGVVAARRGRRATLASLALPVGLAVVGSLGPWAIHSHPLVFPVVFAVTWPIPFAVGYLAASPE